MQAFISGIGSARANRTCPPKSLECFCSWHPMIAVGGRSGKNSQMCPAVTDLWWHVVLEIEADELITPYTVISISTGLFIAT